MRISFSIPSNFLDNMMFVPGVREFVPEFAPEFVVSRAIQQRHSSHSDLHSRCELPPSPHEVPLVNTLQGL